VRRCADRIGILLSALLAGLLLALTATAAVAPAAPAPSAQTAQLLRRHAPLLMLDARERGGPVSVDPFLRGARGASAQAAPARVYGHLRRSRLACDVQATRARGPAVAGSQR